MSDWTPERHAEAREALEEDMSQWGMEYGDDALDEIERLRATLTEARLRNPPWYRPSGG